MKFVFIQGNVYLILKDGTYIFQPFQSSLVIFKNGIYHSFEIEENSDVFEFAFFPIILFDFRRL